MLNILAWCLGALLAAAMPLLPPWWLIGVFAMLATAMVCFRLMRPFGFLLIGALWFLLHATVLIDQSWPDERAGERLEISGQVDSLPESSGQRLRFELKTDAKTQALDVPERILLSWYRPKQWFQPGEHWRLQVRLDAPRGRVNPGGFDYHRYLLSRGVGATGSIDSAERIQAADWRARPNQFRQRFADWLQANTDDLDAAALMRALTVGDRSAMDRELSDDLRRTGTAHLLAISGLHVGMVATLVGFVVGWLLTPLLSFLHLPDRRRVALIAGLFAALLYAMLAGFSLPTQRALIMLTVGFGALLWRRSIQPGHALIAALLAVLLFDPLSPLATGFWLSFAAVAVLIWAFAWRRFSSGWFSGLVRAQIVIMIGLLPLNVGVFQQLIPVALIANLLAIPMVSLWILPCMLAVLGLFALGLPADWALQTAELGLVWLVALLDHLAAWEMAHLARPAPELWAMVLAFIGALWLIAPRGWPARGLGAFLLLPLLFPRIDHRGEGEFDLWLADVGDGLAVIVQTESSTLLYDTGGGDGETSSLFPNTIAPMLRVIGSAEVDTVVISNHQRAHAGGLFAVLEAYPDVLVYRADPGSGQRCAAGHSWQIDGVQFEFLHPSQGLPYLGPDSSCVLEVRSESGSVLLTGRIGDVIGRRLLETGQAEPVDVVVLSRSGHRDALYRPWLEALDPEWTLISVSAQNRRGLPHQDVLDLVIEQTGQRALTTANCGAIGLQFREGSELEVVAWISERRRFWRATDSCH
ncbi:MAG: DNA internalization-related competence protein ComEC/Rec2 [Pseudomonadota bacterium]